MATPAATHCNVGAAGGQNHYNLSYSTADGAGVSTLTQANLAASTGIANILYESDDGTMMMFRADVDTDPIAVNGYPRTETRELQTDGTTNRAFDPTTGDHWIKVVFKVTHLPPFKPSVVVVQMHDNAGDVIEFAVQPVTGYDQFTNPLVELVCRVNGTSLGIPKLIANFQYNTVYQAKIRVGGIAAGGATGWEAYIGDLTTPKLTSSQAGMPAMSTSGTNSYFKWGCYLQTKWTGNGSTGVETDVTEYGESGYRDVQTFHNGETAPGVLTFGTQVYNAITNVRWATATEFQNTSGDGLTAQNITPALPASLIDGDMMFIVVRCRRTASAIPSTSTPASPAIASGWSRIISTHSATTGTSNLVGHNIRFQLWCKKWVVGDVAPTFTYLAATTTDLVNVQMFAVNGCKWTNQLTELLDQTPTGLDLTNPSDNTNTVTGVNYAAAASTTALGATAALAANAAAGSMVLELIAHEMNVTTGTIGVVTGGSDGLTWAHGGSGALATTAGHAWGNDYALVPGSGSSVAIAAKTATGTLATDADPVTAGTQNGKGWGVSLSIAAAKSHSRRRAN